MKYQLGRVECINNNVSSTQHINACSLILIALYHRDENIMMFCVNAVFAAGVIFGFGLVFAVTVSAAAAALLIACYSYMQERQSKMIQSGILSKR